MEDFVLDSSFALAWCFRDEKTPRTDEIRTWLRFTNAVTPPLWKWEVTNGLLVAYRRKRISRDDALVALSTLASLRIHTDPASSLVPSSELWLLADQHSLTVYDTAYLELALRLKLPLATLDDALARAASQTGIKVL